MVTLGLLLQMFFSDPESEMFENLSIFDEVKAYKTVCQFFGYPV